MNETTERKDERKDETKNPLEIVFKKPYVFEGKSYEKIDLSSLEDMTGEQLADIEKLIRMAGVTTLNPEITMEGVFVYASQAAGVPIEFFNTLPAKEVKKVKSAIINFLWYSSMPKTKNPLEIVFKKPYVFEGKSYEKIDLSSLEDMTGEQLADIEKLIRMAGIINLNPETTPEGSFIYASWATDFPIAFFKGIPLVEARRVKVAVINFLWD